MHPPERVLVARAVALRGAAGAAVGSLFVLLACQLDFDDMEIFDFDGGFPLFPSECESDEDCRPGQCCAAFLGTSCRDAAVIDPERSCAVVVDDQFALCACYVPRPEPFCPGLISPNAATCGPHSYARCAVLCTSGLCLCESSDMKTIGDGGAAVPTCPPADWAAVCPDPDAGTTAGG